MRVILPEYSVVVDEETNTKYPLLEATFDDPQPVELTTNDFTLKDEDFVADFVDSLTAKLNQFNANLETKLLKPLFLTLIRTKPLVFAVLALEEEFTIAENYFDKNHSFQLLKSDSVRQEVRKSLASLFQVAFSVLKFEVDNHIAGTPYRIAKMLLPDLAKENELLSGRWNPAPEVRVFEDQDDLDFESYQNGSSSLLNRVVITTVQINSLCAHHFVPYGTVSSNPKSKAVVAYIPDKKVLGLSKISRIVNWLARRPSVQETLTRQIAHEIDKVSEGLGTLVLLKDIEHGCLVRRGRNDTLGLMTTVYATGVFNKDEKLKKQVLRLMQSV